MKKKLKILFIVFALLIIAIAIYGKTQSKTVSAEIIINAPKEVVWDTWSKFNNLDQYVPMVHKSETIGDIDYGLGHTRRCDIANDTYVEEKITAWDSGNSFSMEVYKTKGVSINKMKVNYTISRIEDGVKASIVMNYQMKGLMDFIPIEGVMEQQAIDHLIGLKHLVEIGNKLDGKKLEELREKYSSFYSVVK